MSSLALMRWLESSPERYDAGMRAITLGRISDVHELAAQAAASGSGARVLELGCGTGAITARLVARGARVTALDQNAAMLERARTRLAGQGAVEFVERTAAEIDAMPEHSFDALVSGFCLSEMSSSERSFVLAQAAQRLVPGGRLVIADEVRPASAGSRLVYALLRLPQAALAWLLAGTLSRPIRDLGQELRAAGFAIESEQRWLLGSLALFVARSPA